VGTGEILGQVDDYVRVGKCPTFSMLAGRAKKEFCSQRLQNTAHSGCRCAASTIPNARLVIPTKNHKKMSRIFTAIIQMNEAYPTRCSENAAKRKEAVSKVK
jgi:hypothetical protein